jgi:hypothetical protein
LKALWTKNELQGKNMALPKQRPYQGAQAMIMNTEEYFCKAKEVFFAMLRQVERDTVDGRAIHEIEENLWKKSLELGREILASHVEMQAAKTPVPDSVQHEGRTVQRLDDQRNRTYHSVFGNITFLRDVYALRETQRHEVVPLDAKLGMPEGDISYLLQRWCNARSVNGSYAQVRKSITEIFGFAPSVSALEDMACRAGRHADEYFRNQQPIDPGTNRRPAIRRAHREKSADWGPGFGAVRSSGCCNASLFFLACSSDRRAAPSLSS